MDLALSYFEIPKTKLHLFHGSRLHNPVLKLEVQLRLDAQNALLIYWHNVEVSAVPSAQWRKYWASVREAWFDCEPPYALCVPTPSVMS